MKPTIALTADRSRFTPTQQFTLLLGAALVLGTLFLGGALAWLLQRHLQDETINLTRREVEVHFRDVFGDTVFTGPIPAALAQRFDSTVKTHFNVYDIVQLRLYTTSGRMVYNYLPGLVPPPETPPELFSQAPTDLSPEHMGHVQRALAGNGSTERTALKPDESVAQKPLTSVLEVYVPIRREGQVIGVAEVYRDISRQEAEMRRMQIAAAGVITAGSVLLFFALSNVFRDSTRRIRRQSEALARSFDELAAAHGQSLSALAAALETRDHETEGHSVRVTRYSHALGEALGLSDEDLSALQRGALLHDIGKIGVPDAILRKPGPLLSHEWDQMRQHPDIGSGMVGKIAFLAAALPIVRHHHERYDGTGYPARLAGGHIPLEARIFAIADTFDAMTSDRPYRAALSIEAARDEIKRCAGTQFDPIIVAAFLSLPIEQLREIRDAARGADLETIVPEVLRSPEPALAAAN
ncbi:MAG TPA: HD-GYP domain-containing protein [Chloroflexota bacterium]|nr:HD-GYP domain-containing protein [Chloroflexota bacterium]